MPSVTVVAAPLGSAVAPRQPVEAVALGFSKTSVQAKTGKSAPVSVVFNVPRPLRHSSRPTSTFWAGMR